MSEIRIKPRAQLLTLVGLAAAVAAFVAIQMPEVRRYLKVRQMS